MTIIIIMAVLSRDLCYFPYINLHEKNVNKSIKYYNFFCAFNFFLILTCQNTCYVYKIKTIIFYTF